MDAEAARDKAKLRLDIPAGTTTWDDLLEGMYADLVPKLYPIVKQAYATDYELAADANAIELADIDTDLVGVYAIDYKFASEGDSKHGPMDSADWSVRGGFLYLRTEFDTAVTLRVHGYKRFAEDDIPSQFHHALILWLLADYYRYLVGNRRQYNSYMQQTGARAVDNMLDVANELENTGTQELMDRVNLEGE